MATALPAWVEEAAALPVAFAQVREDALLDQAVVGRLGPGARVILVASGGCTAALLATLPGVAHLHLVDPNPAQLALSRLKLHLLPTSKGERLALLGHAPMPAREREAALARALAALDIAPAELGPADLLAEMGPDHAGRYERLFARLRHELQGHADELADLLRLSDPAEQARRVAPDTALGRALDRAFDEVMALPNLVRLFGEGASRNRREPFARHFAGRTRHVLASLPAADNPYLGQVLLGRFPGETLSPWLAAPAPDRLPIVTWSCTVMEEALRACPGEFDLVQLSNILDWLSPESARDTLDLARAALRPSGWVFVRQLNSTLDIPALGGQFAWLPWEAAALHARDRSYFYCALHLGRRR
jgi:S-adenosylmethionine-diacylglycerol 3-amino-3-carboxypropyl transferase